MRRNTWSRMVLIAGQAAWALCVHAAPVERPRLPTRTEFKAALNARLAPLQSGMSSDHLISLRNDAFLKSTSLSADTLAARTILAHASPQNALEALENPVLKEYLQEHIGPENLSLLPNAAVHWQELSKRDPFAEALLSWFRENRIGVNFGLIFDGQRHIDAAYGPDHPDRATDPMTFDLARRYYRHYYDSLAVAMPSAEGYYPHQEHNAAVYARKTLESELIGQRRKKEFGAYVRMAYIPAPESAQPSRRPSAARRLAMGVYLRLRPAGVNALLRFMHWSGNTDHQRQRAMSGDSTLYEAEHARRIFHKHLANVGFRKIDPHLLNFILEKNTRVLIGDRFANFFKSPSDPKKEFQDSIPRIEPAGLDVEKARIDAALNDIAKGDKQGTLFFDSNVLTNFAGTGRDLQGPPHPLAAHIVAQAKRAHVTMSVEKEFHSFVEQLSMIYNLFDLSKWTDDSDLIKAARALRAGHDLLYVMKWNALKVLEAAKNIHFYSRCESHSGHYWYSIGLIEKLQAFLTKSGIVPVESSKVHSQGDARIIAEIMASTFGGDNVLFATFDKRLANALDNARSSPTLRRLLKREFAHLPNLDLPRPLLLPTHIRGK